MAASASPVALLALELARTRALDVILMDIRMPVMNGREATRAITTAASASAVRVLVLTTFDLDEYVYEALQSRASGFLLKDTDPPELLEAVRIVARGDALLAPAITRKLIGEFARRPAPSRAGPASLAALTEREVLALIARGMNNDELAQSLVVSPPRPRPT